VKKAITDTAASFRISYYQGHASRIFREAVRLRITNLAHRNHRSTADIWKGTVTNANINTTDNVRPWAGWGENPANPNPTDADTVARALINATSTFAVYWVGNRTRGHFGSAHGLEFDRSFAWQGRVFNMQGIEGRQRTTNESVSLLVHETAHLVGGRDHYHDILHGNVCRGWPICGFPDCSPNPRPRWCIMDVTWIGDITTRHVDNIFCTGCRDDIVAHLQRYH